MRLLLVPGNCTEVWDCVAGAIRILIIDDPGEVGGVGVGCHGRTRVDYEGVFVFCGEEYMLRNTPTSVFAKILVSSTWQLGCQLRTWQPS